MANSRDSYGAAEAGAFNMVKTFSKKSISLIELMLTIVILSIGIVMVLKSFLTIANAFGYVKNKMAALQFLDGKMTEIQQMILNQGDVIHEDFGNIIKLGEKNFRWKAAFASVIHDKEELDEMKEIKLSISWKEGAVNKQEVLASYIPTKPEIEEDEE